MSELMQAFNEAMAQLTAPGAPFELGGDADTGRFYRHAPANLREALDAGRQHGGREFLLYEGERRSFRRLFEEADAIAAALQAAGIARGERVAIAMRNYPEWMAAYLAVVSIGAVAVPVNSWGQPADVAHAVEDSGARFVFCDQQRYAGVAQRFDAAGIGMAIARPAHDAHPRSLARLVDAHAGAVVRPVEIGGDDLAMIMYTSGTSGKPKGAASTHRALAQAIYNMECAATAAAMTNPALVGALLERGHEPTSLLAVPLFHVSGCHAQFFANLRGGRRIVMMHKWDVDRALDYIEQERVTAVAAAPSMMLDLLESPRFHEVDTSSLFSLGIGGAATPPRVAQLMRERLPQNFSGTGWGMTETNAQGTSMSGEAFHAKPGCAGFLHPVVDLRVCDEQGMEQPQGQAGEIWVRSPTNVREYWNRPEANAMEFSNGWLKTGDIGYLDDEGFLYLADRAKDLIIRGGENIYPIEVENVLLQHPAAREVAVLGLPHERWGEEVVAVVHLRAGEHLSEDALIAFARTRLAAYKVPSRVVISAAPLPRNATNKVLKRELRDALGAAT